MFGIVECEGLICFKTLRDCLPQSPKIMRGSLNVEVAPLELIDRPTELTTTFEGSGKPMKLRQR